MQTFNTEIVYRVVLTGSDAYEDIFSSLEKPIEYLKIGHSMENRMRLS